MTAREFYYACEEFINFGKIKDIDFSEELWQEPLDGEDHNLVIMSIDFEKRIVELGELNEFRCECCGSYYESEFFDLDQLANEGYLGMVLDRLGDVLIEKTGV